MSESAQSQTATSAETTTIRVFDQYDVDDLTPDRLSEEVDYDCAKEMHGKTHRERNLNVNSMISNFCGELEIKVVDSDEGELSEYEASQRIFEWLSDRYPAFFGDKEALEELGEATITSGFHLDISDIREDYWQGELSSDTVVTNDFQEMCRIVVPIIGIFMQYVLDQADADMLASTEQAQHTIKRTILTEAYEQDLSDNQIDTAVKRAKKELEQTR